MQAFGLLREDDEPFVRLASLGLVTSWFACEVACVLAWTTGPLVWEGLREAVLCALTDPDWEVK